MDHRGESGPGRTARRGLALAAGLVALGAACSPTAPTPDPPPDFSACAGRGVVSLDTIPTRQPHPDFAMLRPALLGDSLAVIDHGIVVDDAGRLHCFWTRGTDWLHGEGVDFGHASSADLVDWSLHGPVDLRTAGVDRMWAPQVVREDGRWCMYFTGVELGGREARNVQRIFLSRSDDLFEWSVPEPVLEPRHPDLAWGTGTDWGDDARDAVVYRYGGQLEMLLTVRHREGDQTLARARRVGGRWGVIDVLSSIRGRSVESAFVHPGDGELYVLVNDWLDGGQAVWVGPDLGGPFERVSTDIPGFALEIVQVDAGILLSSRVWGSAVLFSRIFAPDFRATNMIFPACYTGDRPLLQAGDNLVDIADPGR